MQDRYQERRDYLKQTIHDLNADIIGLQEVAFGKDGQLDEILSDQFIEYQGPIQIKFHEFSHPDPEARLDGNAIIVNKKANKQFNIIEHKILHLSHVRCAQRLLIQFNQNQNSNLYIINVHLHHIIEDSIIRKYQLQCILDWISNLKRQQQNNFMIIGDFNFTPNSDEYRLMINEGFISSYAQIQQKEPIFTFPTGLTGPFMDTDPSGTFDYIWYYGKNLKVTNSVIFGQSEHPSIKDVYPSDHMGIMSDFVYEQ